MSHSSVLSCFEHRPPKTPQSFQSQKEARSAIKKKTPASPSKKQMIKQMTLPMPLIKVKHFLLFVLKLCHALDELDIL